MPDVVLDIKRIVMHEDGGKSVGKDLHISRASCWQSVRAKGHDGVRVRRISVERVRIRRRSVEDARIRRGWRRHVEGWSYDQSGIEKNTRGDGKFFLVIVNTVTAADHD